MLTMHAHWIIPDGKAIELSQEAYQQIRKLMGESYCATQTPRHIAEISATYGKYAGKPSLVQALLEERKAECVREETKLKRCRV
jgi:hypothetical protein